MRVHIFLAPVALWSLIQLLGLTAALPTKLNEGPQSSQNDHSQDGNSNNKSGIPEKDKSSTSDPLSDETKDKNDTLLNSDGDGHSAENSSSLPNLGSSNNNNANQPFSLSFQRIEEITSELFSQHDAIESIYMQELSTLLIATPTSLILYDIRQFRIVYRHDTVQNQPINVKSIRYFLSESQVEFVYILFQIPSDNCQFKYFALNLETLEYPIKHLQIAHQGFADSSTPITIIHDLNGFPTETELDVEVLLESVPGVVPLSFGLRLLAFDRKTITIQFGCAIVAIESTSLVAKCTKFNIDKQLRKQKHFSALSELTFNAVPLLIQRIPDFSEHRFALICNSTSIITFQKEFFVDFEPKTLVMPADLTDKLGDLGKCTFNTFIPFNWELRIMGVSCKGHLTLIILKPFLYVVKQAFATSVSNSQGASQEAGRLQLLPITKRLLEIQGSVVRVIHLREIGTISIKDATHEYKISLTSNNNSNSSSIVNPIFFETGSTEDHRALPFLVEKELKSIVIRSALCSDTNAGYFIQEMTCLTNSCEGKDKWMSKGSGFQSPNNGFNNNKNINQNSQQSELAQRICYTNNQWLNQQNRMKFEAISISLSSILLIVILGIVCIGVLLLLIIKCCPASIFIPLKRRLDSLSLTNDQRQQQQHNNNVQHIQLQEEVPVDTVIAIDTSQIKQEDNVVIEVAADAKEREFQPTLDNQQSEQTHLNGQDNVYQPEKKSMRQHQKKKEHHHVVEMEYITPTPIDDNFPDQQMASKFGGAQYQSVNDADSYYNNPRPYVENPNNDDYRQMSKLQEQDPSKEVLEENMRVASLIRGNSDGSQLQNSSSHDAFLKLMEENMSDNVDRVNGGGGSALGKFMLGESEIRQAHAIPKEQRNQMKYNQSVAAGMDASALQLFEQALAKEFGAGGAANGQVDNPNAHAVNYFELAASMLKKAMFAQQSGIQNSGESQQMQMQQQQQIVIESSESGIRQKQRSVGNRSDILQIQSQEDNSNQQVEASQDTSNNGNNSNNSKSSQQQLEEQQENSQCKICFFRANNSVIVPCGHRICKECGPEVKEKMKVCPFCKKEIKDIIQFYGC